MHTAELDPLNFYAGRAFYSGAISKVSEFISGKKPSSHTNVFSLLKTPQLCACRN